MKLFPTTGLMLLLLSGCAHLNTPESLAKAPQPDTSQVETATTTTEVAPSTEVAVTKTTSTQTSAEQLQQMLAAEMYLIRGDLIPAMSTYTETLPEQKDPEILARITELALQLNKLDVAAQSVKQWLEYEPDSSRAWTRSTLISLKLRDLETLGRSLTWLLENQSKDSFVVLLTQIAGKSRGPGLLEGLQRVETTDKHIASLKLSQAFLLQSINQIELALFHAEQALLRDPDWITAINLKVRLLIQSQQSELAMAFLQQQVDRLPNDRDLQIFSARLYVQQEQHDKAEQAFEAVLNINNEDPVALMMLGSLKYENKQLDRALGYFQRIPFHTAQYNRALLSIAQIYEEQGKTELAIEHYLKVEGHQQQTAARIQAALLLKDQQDYQRALEISQSIRPRSGQEYSRVLLLQSDIYEQQQQIDKALEILDHGLSLKEDDIDLLYARSMLAIKLDDLDEFERGMRKIIELRPDYAFALNALGYTLVDKTNRLDEAEELITKALKLAPDEPAILDSMGWLLFKQGNPHEALGFLQKAWQGDQDPEIAAHLGEVLWLLSREDEALQIWRQAIEASPDHPVLNETLERFNQ